MVAKEACQAISDPAGTPYVDYRSDAHTDGRWQVARRDTMTDLGPLVLLGLTVAFTALPLIGVITLMLDTGRPIVGWVFTGSYAAGIFLVYILVSVGAIGIRAPIRWPGPVGEIVAGVLLLIIATVLVLVPPGSRRRRRSRAPRSAGSSKIHVTVGAAGLGFQFAFHPENIALITAAALRSEMLTLLSRGIEAVVFCAVGVSTCAALVVTFSAGGPRMRSRLGEVRRLVIRDRRPIGVALLICAGALLVVIGLAQYVPVVSVSGSPCGPGFGMLADFTA